MAEWFSTFKIQAFTQFSGTKKPSFRKNEKMVDIFKSKDLPALINACGNLRQKLSISYVLYDDVQPILYVRS